MLNLIYENGPVFIAIITIIFLIVIVISYLNGKSVLNGDNDSLETHRIRISYIKSLGLLALVTGIFGQLIGLYSAFNALSTLEGGISPHILIAGLKVSIVPTIYGMMVYICSYIIWLALSWKLKSPSH